MWLALPKTVREFEQIVSTLGQAPELADDIEVNRDRVLSIDATVPDEERVRWVSWVDVDVIEMRRFHGRKAIKCGRVTNKI